jgi:hypothetical protein
MRSRRFERLPIDAGIAPDMEFIERSIDCNEMRLPNESGIGPVIEFFHSSNFLSFVSWPREEGNRPESAF